MEQNDGVEEEDQEMQQRFILTASARSRSPTIKRGWLIRGGVKDVEENARGCMD
jgi:hypothetical protein